jgi:hypothetical protein
MRGWKVFTKTSDYDRFNAWIIRGLNYHFNTVYSRTEGWGPIGVFDTREHLEEAVGPNISAAIYEVEFKPSLDQKMWCLEGDDSDHIVKGPTAYPPGTLFADKFCIVEGASNETLEAVNS